MAIAHRRGCGMTTDQIQIAREPDVAAPRALEREDAVSLELTWLADRLGVPVMCFDLRSGRVVACTDEQLLPVVPPELMWQCVQTGEARIQALASGLICVAIPIPGSDSGAHVA